MCVCDRERNKKIDTVEARMNRYCIVYTDTRHT